MTSTNPVDLLAFALSEQRTVMTDPTGSVTLELTADGSITAIRLSEAGHRMTPAMVAEVIMSLHTAGLAQAQMAIEAALSEGEVPAIPELDLADTPASPSLLATEGPVPAAPTDLTAPVQPVPPSTPPWPITPAEHTTAQPSRDQPLTSPSASSARAAYLPHMEVPGLAPDHAPGPNPAPAHPDDPIDEDEYFRNFSVFEYDNHHPRGRT